MRHGCVKPSPVLLLLWSCPLDEIGDMGRLFIWFRLPRFLQIVLVLNQLRESLRREDPRPLRLGVQKVPEGATDASTALGRGTGLMQGLVPRESFHASLVDALVEVAQHLGRPGGSPRHVARFPWHSVASRFRYVLVVVIRRHAANLRPEKVPETIPFGRCDLSLCRELTELIAMKGQARFPFLQRNTKRIRYALRGKPNSVACHSATDPFLALPQLLDVKRPAMRIVLLVAPEIARIREQYVQTREKLVPSALLILECLLQSRVGAHACDDGVGHVLVVHVRVGPVVVRPFAVVLKAHVFLDPAQIRLLSLAHPGKIRERLVLVEVLLENRFDCEGGVFSPPLQRLAEVDVDALAPSVEVDGRGHFGSRGCGRGSRH